MFITALSLKYLNFACRCDRLLAHETDVYNNQLPAKGVMEPHWRKLKLSTVNGLWHLSVAHCSKGSIKSILQQNTLITPDC